MSVLWTNALANALGQLIYPILSLALVPLYIRYLGLEGYGLIGFLAVLVSLLGVFTKGLGTALQREFALREPPQSRGGSPLRLLRTFEVVYWAIGAVLAFGMLIAADWMAANWVTTDAIDQSTVEWCLWLAGARLALAFPWSVYQAAFVGVQRQVLFNGLSAGISVVAATAGVVVVLTWPSVVGLYATDVAIHAAGIWVLRRYSVRVLGDQAAVSAAGFDFDEVRQLARISLGLIWTNGIGLLVTQMDRLLVSVMLPIASLGIYTAGTAGGRLLGMLYLPFLTAVFPQTCRLADRDGGGALGPHLLRNVRVTVLICATCALPLIWFSAEILELWTQSSVVPTQGSRVMTIYVLGTICIAQASVFYQGQLALGWTRFGVVFNSLALIWFPLTLWYLVSAYGLEGAAGTWAIYCGLGWLYNTCVTSWLLGQKGWLMAYVTFTALAAFVSAGIGFGAQILADACCTGSPATRLGIGLAASAITLVAVWPLAFGLASPRQLVSQLQ